MPKSVDVKTDLIGVGAGPANLSLASLLTTARERELTSITATFFEREATVFWHSLQMFPGASPVWDAAIGVAAFGLAFKDNLRGDAKGPAHLGGPFCIGLLTIQPHSLAFDTAA